MVKALVFDLILIPDCSHLLADDEPVQIYITVLDGILRVALRATSLLLVLVLLPSHALPNDIVDLLLKIVNVLELFNGLKLHAVLAELLNVGVEVGHLHVAELSAVVRLALLG